MDSSLVRYDIKICDLNIPTPSAPKTTILGLGKDLIKTSESIEFKDFA